MLASIFPEAFSSLKGPKHFLHLDCHQQKVINIFFYEKPEGIELHEIWRGNLKAEFFKIPTFQEKTKWMIFKLILETDRGGQEGQRQLKFAFPRVFNYKFL